MAPKGSAGFKPVSPSRAASTATRRGLGGVNKTSSRAMKNAPTRRGSFNAAKGTNRFQSKTGKGSGTG